MGDTIIKIKIDDKNNNFNFQLKNNRKIDRKTVNLIRNKEISAIIKLINTCLLKKFFVNNGQIKLTRTQLLVLYLRSIFWKLLWWLNRE